MRVRKWVLIRERTEAEEAGEAAGPVTRAVAAAVFENPCAGGYVADLSPLFEMAGLLGERLAAEALAALEGPAISYGKGALVGVDGAMEHGAAVLHPTLGKPMRAAVGGGAALIPANTKVAALGTVLDLPLGHKDEPWAFDYIDTVTVSVADAPRPGEIVLFVGLSDGPRPAARVGSGPRKS